ncbi:MAG: hypothetical protein EXS64_02205 [Candidatus Latescibacteria bacterium]|nr:hypothetical protein [Candidatus Latescibacterota bacterium]
MRLTHEEIRLFRHNGFLKLKDRLPEETVGRLKEAIWKDIQAEVEPVVRDREGRVVRLSNLLDRDPVFQEVLTGPTVLDPLESLLGPNIVMIKNRHNHATLRTASVNSDKLHRDMLQWTRDIVTVLFYLEESTLEKGCTQVIPGTHVLPWSDGLYNIVKEDWVQQSGILDQTVPVPMPAGGLLVIDSMILHGAGQNTTSETRISMTAGYHSVDELAETPSPKVHLARGQFIYKGNDNYN